MIAPAGLTVVAEAVAYVPATCGELVQGVDDEGPLLVSLPVAIDGSVEVALVRESVFDVSPSLPRARAALELALDRAGWSGGAAVRLGGEVPHGRGMGSSTVDVAGVMGAVMAATGTALPPAELVRLMTSIEPSDSSPLPGLWAVDHVRGTRVVPCGSPPPGWRLVVVDSGQPVDTATVHATWGAGPRLPASTLARVLSAAGDGGALAALATESAHRNQERLAHPAFAAVCDVAAAVCAAGICAAHSGSLCAVICSDEPQAAEAHSRLRAMGLAAATWRTSAGGLRVRVRAGAAA